LSKLNFNPDRATKLIAKTSGELCVKNPQNHGIVKQKEVNNLSLFDE